MKRLLRLYFSLISDRALEGTVRIHGINQLYYRCHNWSSFPPYPLVNVLVRSIRQIAKDICDISDLFGPGEIERIAQIKLEKLKFGVQFCNLAEYRGISRILPMYSLCIPHHPLRRSRNEHKRRRQLIGPCICVFGIHWACLQCINFISAKI